MFVADAGDLRVQRYTSSGVFERAWGKDVVQSGHAGDTGTGYEVCTVAADCKAGVTGTLGGEFGGGGGGLGIAFGNAQVFVSDANDNRVQRFDVAGAFQRAWGKGVNGGGAFGVCTVAASCQAGATGGLGGELAAPSAIAADGAGVYVAESAGRRLQQFDFNGIWSDAWGRGVKNGTTGYGHCTVGGQLPGGHCGRPGRRVLPADGSGGRRHAPGGRLPGNGVVVVADAGNGRLDEIISYANGASGPDRGSTFATNGFTQSSFQHPYELFYGTLTLTRPDGSTYRTLQGFASQIRVTQAGADDLAQALANEPRVVQGFAGSAPDGGPWITTAADPLWWERPNGAGAPLDQPTFDAQSAFAGQLSAQAQLAAGESASCADTAGTTRTREHRRREPVAEEDLHRRDLRARARHDRARPGRADLVRRLRRPVRHAHELAGIHGPPARPHLHRAVCPDDGGAPAGCAALRSRPRPSQPRPRPRRSRPSSPCRAPTH